MPQTKPRPPEEEPATTPAPVPVFMVPAPQAVLPAGPLKEHDETEPGGRFYRGDKLVNSEGQRIHEDGTLLSQGELAQEV